MSHSSPHILPNLPQNLVKAAQTKWTVSFIFSMKYSSTPPLHLSSQLPSLLSAINAWSTSYSVVPPYEPHEYD